MSLLRYPRGKCRAHTLCLCQVGRGKGGCRSGNGRTTHSWHDGLSHAPVWTDVNAYRVICHPGDEDEGVRWVCRARQQMGPVEIASAPAPVVLRLGRTWLSASTGGGIFIFLPWLARLAGLPNGRVPADGSPGRTDDWKSRTRLYAGPTAREV